MFDLDMDLDLGSRRKPTEWVVTAPAVPPKMSVKSRRRRKNRGAKAAAEAGAADGSSPSNGRRGARGNGTTNTCNKELMDQLKRRQEPRDLTLVSLPPEEEDGQIEYKLRIQDSNPVRLQQLITQMKFRLSEGDGECRYYVGVEDDGYPRGLEPIELQKSVLIVQRMATTLRATASVAEYLQGAHGRKCALLHVKRNFVEDVSYTDLRIAVAGSADSGKSTLVAVLTHGSDGRPLLDNGKGAARMNVFRHKHEIETGRTSSISQQIVGYDEEGRVLNYAGVSALTPEELSSVASKVLTFIDVGGHEKYLKTALYGLTCLMPDYMLLCVCAATGVSRITREHLAVAIALQIPVAVVITKSDIVSHDNVKAVLSDLRQLVARAASGLSDPRHQPPNLQEIAALLSTEDAARGVAETFSQMHVPEGPLANTLHVPMFVVSSVSGTGLHLLHAFLGGLHPAAAMKNSPDKDATNDPDSSNPLDGGLYCVDAPVQFQIDHTYEVDGVGLVVSGTLVQGLITTGQQLLWGPTRTASFTPVTVTCIQRSHIPVKHIKAGQTGTLALQPHEDPPDQHSSLDAVNSLQGQPTPPTTSTMTWPSVISELSEMSASARNVSPARNASPARDVSPAHNMSPARNVPSKVSPAGNLPPASGVMKGCGVDGLGREDGIALPVVESGDSQLSDADSVPPMMANLSLKVWNVTSHAGDEEVEVPTAVAGCGESAAVGYEESAVGNQSGVPTTAAEHEESSVGNESALRTAVARCEESAGRNAMEVTSVVAACGESVVANKSSGDGHVTEVPSISGRLDTVIVGQNNGPKVAQNGADVAGATAVTVIDPAQAYVKPAENIHHKRIQDTGYRQRRPHIEQIDVRQDTGYSIRGEDDGIFAARPQATECNSVVHGCASVHNDDGMGKAAVTAATAVMAATAVTAVGGVDTRGGVKLLMDGGSRGVNVGLGAAVCDGGKEDFDFLDGLEHVTEAGSKGAGMGLVEAVCAGGKEDDIDFFNDLDLALCMTGEESGYMEDGDEDLNDLIDGVMDWNNTMPPASPACKTSVPGHTAPLQPTQTPQVDKNLDGGSGTNLNKVKVEGKFRGILVNGAKVNEAKVNESKVNEAKANEAEFLGLGENASDAVGFSVGESIARAAGEESLLQRRIGRKLCEAARIIRTDSCGKPLGCSLPSPSPTALFGTSPAASASPPNSRKGAVLLDVTCRPRTYWAFEAVLVLLGGHWPPRGLISGQWPPHPLDNAPLGTSPYGGSGSGSDTCGSYMEAANLRSYAEGAGSVGKGKSGRGRNKRQGHYVPVVHTGSVRQAARVVSMEEMAEEEVLQLGAAQGCWGPLSHIHAAGALLQQRESYEEWESPQSPSGPSASLGCVVSALFHFEQRPEWLTLGARLIVRDRGDGRVAGAGFVKSLVEQEGGQS